jgi:hypothetical protein
LFEIDWLHVMDLGVTCDFLGNCFSLFLQHYPQPTTKGRVQDSLFLGLLLSFARLENEKQIVGQ